jgi:hypothetical protein
VFSPNEARAEEDLPAVEYGDEPRVQVQVQPLSAGLRPRRPHQLRQRRFRDSLPRRSTSRTFFGGRPWGASIIA